jgi:hypothetical protein
VALNSYYALLAETQAKTAVVLGRPAAGPAHVEVFVPGGTSRCSCRAARRGVRAGRHVEVFVPDGRARGRHAPAGRSRIAL